MRLNGTYSGRFETTDRAGNLVGQLRRIIDSAVNRVNNNDGLGVGTVK